MLIGQAFKKKNPNQHKKDADYIESIGSNLRNFIQSQDSNSAFKRLQQTIYMKMSIALSQTLATNRYNPLVVKAGKSGTCRSK